jgi:hypothetical protein
MYLDIVSRISAYAVQPNLLLLNSLPDHGNIACNDCPEIVLRDLANIRPRPRVVAHLENGSLFGLRQHDFETRSCVFFRICARGIVWDC